MPGIPGYEHDGGVQPTEHIPTEKSRAMVAGYCCAGYTQEEIAEFMDMHVNTLAKHYRVELKTAKSNKIRRISTKAYKLALKGDVKMIEFVLKYQGKWAAAKAPEDTAKDEKTQTLMEKLIDKL